MAKLPAPAAVTVTVAAFSTDDGPVIQRPRGR